MKGSLTAYKLPEIKRRKHTKFIPDKNAPVVRSIDEIDLKFEINRIHDPGSLAPRQRLVKNKAALEASQRDIIALRGEVKDILSEEHPPPFNHPRKEIKQHEVKKEVPAIFETEIDIDSVVSDDRASSVDNIYLHKPASMKKVPAIVDNDIASFMKRIKKKYDKSNEELEVDRFLLYDEELKKQYSDLQVQMYDLEADAKENIWLKQKKRLKQRTLLKQLLNDMSGGHE